jgi:hypothetical protein
MVSTVDLLRQSEHYAFAKVSRRFADPLLLLAVTDSIAFSRLRKLLGLSVLLTRRAFGVIHCCGGSFPGPPMCIINKDVNL